MTRDERIVPGSEVDLALERALEAASLRAGDGPATAWTSTVETDLGAAEAGDSLGGMDAD